MNFGFQFFFNSILLGVGLAMDAFSVSLANGLNEPTMPMTVVPTEGDDFLYLILPVRLRSNE